MEKEMIFVIGPESSGTRGATNFLIKHGNYWGTNAHIQPLDKCLNGEELIENVVPKDVNKIILRRSIPHASIFPNLNEIDTFFLNSGYRTKWVIIIREISEIVRSKISRNTAMDEMDSWMKTVYQYNWIFENIACKSDNVNFFPYTSIVKAQNQLIGLLEAFKIL